MTAESQSEKLKSAEEVPQRRQATILCTDLCDSTRLAEFYEAEDFVDAIARFRDEVRTIVPTFGGTVARIQGDGALCVFGFPVAHEGDGRQAADAALSLHAAIAKIKLGQGSKAVHLSARSGIHAGVVLIGSGDLERGRIDLQGDAVNVAFRLCSQASPGRICVGRDSLHPHQHAFAFEELGDAHLKGRRDPVRKVLMVSGHSTAGQPLAVRTQESKFIGREPAIAKLLALATEVRRSKAAAVAVVSGEAGVGKSRFLAHFRQSLPGCDFEVLHGCCEAHLGAEPLQPFMHWIRNMLALPLGGSPRAGAAAAGQEGEQHGIDGVQAVPARDALLGWAERSSSALPSPAVLVAAIMDLLELMAQHKTLCLIVDDWQWADDAGRSALSLLLGRKFPLLLLVATRPTSVPSLPADALQIELPPLSREETQEFASSLLSFPDPFLLEEVHSHSGGNPLFIQELCGSLEDGQLRLPEFKGGIAWINNLVASRVERLAPRERGWLDLAAVMGANFPAGLIVRLLGADEALELVEALASARFLERSSQSTTVQFRHLLVREAVYALVNSRDRTRLHSRVAEAYADATVVTGAGVREEVEALAYHFSAAKSYAKAAHYAELAGDRALAAQALDRAQAQYLTALRALNSLEELTLAGRLRWCEIAQKLGHVSVFDPLSANEGLAFIQKARDLAREDGAANLHARAEYWLGYVHYGQGRPRQAIRHCLRAIELAAASGDDRLAAQVHATLGQAYICSGRYDQGVPLLDAAVAAKRQSRRAGSGAAVGSAYSIARKAYSLGDQGHFSLAYEGFADANALLSSEPHPVRASIAGLACAVHIWQGDWEAAEAAAERSTSIAMWCRSHYLVAMSRALGACASWARTREDTYLLKLDESTRWIEAHGGAASLSFAYGWQVEALVHSNDLGGAISAGRRVVQRARHGDVQGLAQGYRGLAAAAIAQGQAPTARRRMAAADRAGRARRSERELAMNALARAEFALALENLPDARAAADMAGSVFTRLGMAVYALRCEDVARSASSRI